jgi:hypothetical protein
MSWRFRIFNGGIPMFATRVSVTAILWAAPVLALGPVPSIDHHSPSTEFDNVGAGLAGQTFLAVDTNFYGVRLDIGKAGGPPSLGPLTGPADLVLMDAANLAAPIELVRHQFLESGVELEEAAFDILLPSPVATQVGARYFVGIDATDPFGVGLRHASLSTYADGAESFFNGSQITVGGSGRDLSFRIYKLGSTTGGQVFTSIEHLSPPLGWDNLGAGLAGQTFLAAHQNFFGVRLHIGQAGGPPSLGSLIGPADLVLMDAANYSAPIELARFEVVGSGAERQGVFDFLFPAAIPTEVGHRYYFGIDAADLFGMGLANGSMSTYPDGEEAYHQNGVITPRGSMRDLSFRVYWREPGIVDAPYLTPPLCRAANYSEGRCNDTAPGIDSFAATAVLDHLGGYYQSDGLIRAFRTDLGCSSPPCLGQANFGANVAPSGYRQDCNGTPIHIFGLAYVGAAGSGGVGSCPGGSTNAAAYLNYDGHSGYDFDTSFGDVVVAAAAGYLDAPTGSDPVLGPGVESFNALRIRHYNGSETWYLHSQPTSQCALAGLCTPGQIVPIRARQPIALAGNTGLGCGPCSSGSCPCDHLHFELRPADEPIDSVDPFGWRVSRFLLKSRRQVELMRLSIPSTLQQD